MRGIRRNNRNGGGRGGGGASAGGGVGFLPNQLSGLQLWLRGDMGVTTRTFQPISADNFSAWGQVRVSTAVNNQANPIDGALTADTITEDASVATTHFLNLGGTQGPTATTDTITYSVYAKAIVTTRPKSWIMLEAGGAGSFTSFNLTDGAVGTSAGAPVPSSATITNAGNGWWKCSLTVAANVFTALNIYMAEADNDITYTGDGTSSVALFRAAIEGATSFVSAWADQSGTGDTNKNAVQATAANQPVYNSSDSAYSSKATFTFDGSSDFLASGAWAGTLNQPFTVFAVGNDSGAGVAQVYAEGDSDVSGTQRMILYNNGGGTGIFAGATLSQAVLTNAKRVVGGIFNGVSSKFFHSAKTAVATGDAGANQPYEYVFVGSTFAGTAVINGKVAEVIVYSRVLTQAEVDALMDYFGHRYGITIGA